MKVKLLSTLFVLMLSVSAFAAGNLYEQLNGEWFDGNFVITIDSKNNHFVQKLRDGHIFSEGSIVDVQIKGDKVVEFSVKGEKKTIDFINKNSFSLGAASNPFTRIK